MRAPIALLLLLAVGVAGAQSRDSLPQPDALPPPEMDDPGVDPAGVEPDVVPAAEPVADAAVAAPRAADATPVLEGELPPKVQPPGDPPPAVTIRTDVQTGDVIEEYSQNGVVYMVRVRPERGPEYMLLDTNGDGRLDQQDGEGPVRPVYWTIYEWE